MTRLDNQMANLLVGKHAIEGSQEDKVVQLVELAILENATMNMGWARHTGDWDWFIIVNGEEDIELAYDNGLEFLDADRNLLNFLNTESADFLTACVDFQKVVYVQLSDSSSERHLLIRIEDIHTLTWDQA